jgi:hypothetical protein
MVSSNGPGPSHKAQLVSGKETIGPNARESPGNRDLTAFPNGPSRLAGIACWIAQFFNTSASKGQDPPSPCRDGVEPVGVAAAIANAVYHATGKRIRDLPITIDKVLGD